jgi:hypothetical protein
MGFGLFATCLINALTTKRFFTGPIKIQSDSVMVRYFFVDCHLLDPTRIAGANVITSLKYYNEGIVSHINLRTLICLRNVMQQTHLFTRCTYGANPRQ